VAEEVEHRRLGGPAELLGDVVDAGQRVVEGGMGPVHGGVHDDHEHVLLVRDVVVEVRGRDGQGPADVLHRRAAVALPGEELGRRRADGVGRHRG
jgi:hypothetical protein